jgi:hypothetical protein
MVFEVQRLKEKRRNLKKKVDKWQVWKKFRVACFPTAICLSIYFLFTFI